MKRILSIVLAIAVTICFMPEFSFAASSENGLPYGVKVIAKSDRVLGNVNHQGNELENMKQQALELFQEEWDEFVLDQKFYAPAVYSEMTALYKSAVDKIKNAKKIEDFLQMGMFGYTLTDDLVEYVDMIEYLSTLTIQQGIKGDNALSKAVTDLEKYKNEVFAQYKMSAYNNWYQDIISEFKLEANRKIAALKKSPSFAECARVRTFIEKYDNQGTDEDGLDFEIEFDDDADAESLYYFDDEKLVYTKAEVTENISQMYAALNVYKVEVLSAYAEMNSVGKKSKSYTDMEKKLSDISEKFNKEAVKIPDVETIFEKYMGAMWDMDKAAGLTENNNLVDPSSSDILRLIKAIDELYMSYDITLYSSTQAGNLESLYLEYSEDKAYEFMYTKKEAETMESRAAARAKYVAKLKTKFDKIPVKTVELKNNRTKYYSKLVKKYKTNGKKKYNQKKVKKVLAQAKAEMNKAAEPEDIETIYEKYVEKLNKTINKYTIKTSKKGKGKISKTKKVKYGKSYTVKFTPKAGYKIKRIYVDGKKLKKLKNKYTFKKVKKPHKVRVIFKK